MMIIRNIIPAITTASCKNSETLQAPTLNPKP